MDSRVVELLCLYSGMNPSSSPPPAEEDGLWGWVDSLAAVYADGEMIAEAQVLERAGARQRAVVLPGQDEVWLLDEGPRGGNRLLGVPRDAFRLAADRDSARCEAGAVRPRAGRWQASAPTRGVVVAEDTLWEIRPRHVPAGEVTVARLWEAAPVWEARARRHRPSPALVEALRDCRQPTLVTIAFAAWCHLSKEFLPLLVQAVETAENPRVQLRLLCVDEAFLEPRDAIRELRLVNVPVVIVEQAGRELGRMVETPALASVEEDLAAILAQRRLPRHPGRWSRGPLAANGSYRCRSSCGTWRGREDWQLFTLPAGGALLHSRRENEKDETSELLETWQRLDRHGRPQLLEVTETLRHSVSRARHLVDGGRLTAWSRGTRHGNLSQRMNVGQRFALLSPALAAAGWPWLQARTENRRRSELECYLAPLSSPSSLGATVPVRFELDPTPETVRTPAGELAGHLLRFELETAVGWTRAQAFLHPRLLVPLRGTTAGGMSYELASLELSGEADGLWENPADFGRPSTCKEEEWTAR